MSRTLNRKTMNSKRSIPKRNSWQRGLHLTSLGWELAVPIFGGAFLGYHLDRILGTKYTLTLIFLFIGIISGYYSLYKYIELEMLRTKFAKRQTRKEKTP